MLILDRDGVIGGDGMDGEMDIVLIILDVQVDLTIQFVLFVLSVPVHLFDQVPLFDQVHLFDQVLLFDQNLLFMLDPLLCALVPVEPGESKIDNLFLFKNRKANGGQKIYYAARKRE